ncbi:MAG: T9SS type A sorting domain-containing protein [Bacteroidota bacterium]|nr:T9SS type A sorting domain-containing protein [Bacteroidota bacterium]MDP3431402.1 T9SS type A sorting domain-containing protein [Bacteroidota bacterium]
MKKLILSIFILCMANSISSPVTLILYNLQGQLISTILNNQYLTKGNTVTFNLRNEVASSGIYLLRLTNKDNSFTRKVILN